jgi:hypothetical protein
LCSCNQQRANGNKRKGDPFQQIVLKTKDRKSRS